MSSLQERLRHAGQLDQTEVLQLPVRAPVNAKDITKSKTSGRNLPEESKHRRWLVGRREESLETKGCLLWQTASRHTEIREKTIVLVENPEREETSGTWTGWKVSPNPRASPR